MKKTGRSVVLTCAIRVWVDQRCSQYKIAVEGKTRRCWHCFSCCVPQTNLHPSDSHSLCTHAASTTMVDRAYVQGRAMRLQCRQGCGSGDVVVPANACRCTRCLGSVCSSLAMIPGRMDTHSRNYAVVLRIPGVCTKT